MYQIIISIITFLSLLKFCYLNKNIAYNIPDPECTGIFNLCTDADKERLGRQAIRAIHEQMDDDKDGLIEPSETTDFIKEELEDKTGSIRHEHFQNANLQITFNDLWSQWHKSPIYNWTTDNVVDWLINYVHLPQYVENFRRNQFDGRMIPRLATNEKHYLSSIMQIRDPRHKRRLIIKATDAVLFGPPPRTHNLIKDIILTSALLISFGACLYAFIRHRKTQESMNIMIKELETLQKAEQDLVAVTGKMKAMENELKDKTKVERGLLNSWFMEVQQTKAEADKCRKTRDNTLDHEKQLRLAIQEIEQLRIALRKAEEHAQHQTYEPPAELIELLKRTYHIEEATFEAKRKAAENAMLTAKEQMIKISKMQKGFFGAVRIAHTGCMDNISELIHAAKERLAEVQDEYEEREKRWNRIASLIDRDDLISNGSTSTTTSMIGNQGLPVLTNTSLNNSLTSVLRNRGIDGRNFTGTIDIINRTKQMSLDSTHLINSANEPISNMKPNSQFNNRGFTLHTNHVIRQDAITHSDSVGEYLNSPVMSLKRRTMNNSALLSNNSSTERLSANTKMIYSHSSNGLNTSILNTPKMVRTNTDDSLDVLTSTNRQTRPIFDIVTDPQVDNNDSIQDDRKSQKSNSINDEQITPSSIDKRRKQVLSSKLFKSFHNIRFRKKNSFS